MALKKGEKRPTHLEVTALRRIVGPDWDEKTGQKIVLEPGDDAKIPYTTARRLEGNGRVAIGPEDRAAARKAAKRSAPKTGGQGGAKNGDKQ